MSTFYHTEIATGAAANAATFNGPLGTLDQKINDIVTGAQAFSGNVGIGVTPAERLHVYSSGGGAVNVLIGNGDTGATGSDGFELGIDASENAMLWNFENTAMIFGTNNAERMRITNSGSIGIGTNAPAERLHLYSSGTGAVNLLIGNADTGAAATDGFRVGITSSEVAILMNYENTNMEFGTNNVVRMVISAAGVVRTVGEIEIDGDLNHDGSNAGFYGSAPVAKATVTGSRGGNAALASLLTALANLGLITDSSS